jgi:hypothetical protein
MLQEVLQSPLRPPSSIPHSMYTDFETHLELLKWIIYVCLQHTILLHLHCVSALSEWYEDFNHSIIIHFAYQHEH